jgi:anthranilate synthase/aminodeoxychorismate synthase-like glutamine amidotransferase
MLGADVVVVRDNALTAADVVKMAPDKIVISPGPSTPERAGISNEVIRRFAGKKPILGVCLGHQCIGHSFGGTVDRAQRIMHGKSSLIHHSGAGVFAGLPDPFPAIRYHSLAIRRDRMPDCLEVTAWTEDGEVMGVRHRHFQIEGVQFHPESFMTEKGMDILRNFLGRE